MDQAALPALCGKRDVYKRQKYGFAMEHSKEGVRAAASYMTKQVEPVLEKLIRAKGKIEEVI